MATHRRSSHRRRHVSAALVGAAVVLGGLSACSGGDDKADGLSIMSRVESEVTTSTTTPTTVPATTTLPASTTTVEAAPPEPPAGLGPGDSGDAVAALEQKLDALRYDVGSVDGSYDQNTAYGVTAFQKISGADPNGRATDDILAAVNATTSSPPALVPGGGANRVEVDLGRQVLFLYQGDALFKILPVSSGNGERFCSEGWCRRAVTNPGSFRVYRQAGGWEKGPLGSLYNPNYFDGGIAIHGATSVPASPASHGCVRIPMGAAEWFPDYVPLGTPVYVTGEDGTPPSPLPPELPPEPPPDIQPPTTEPAFTTTTAPRGIDMHKEP